jgi:hypothetical protein
MKDSHPKIELYKKKVEVSRGKLDPFSKKEDKLLVAINRKRMEEKKKELEKTYENVKEEIDEEFEKKRQEIMEMHRQEVDRERERLKITEDNEVYRLKLKVTVAYILVGGRVRRSD